MTVRETSGTVRPLIGITGARLQAAEITTTPPILLHTWVDTHYTYYPEVVARAGGLPVHLPRESDPRDLVSRLDGLIVAGGQDVDPRSYGRQPTPTNSRLDPGRDGFELGLVHAALSLEVPLLGICRGAQLMNVALGGTLVEDLVSVQEVEHTLVLYPPEARVHEVVCAPGSLVHELYGERLHVNSFHHQGIADLGRGIATSGVATDGTIEAIEVEAAAAVGVQWHPEMLPGDADPIFAWLVDRSGRNEAEQIRLERSNT
jgi:putative glutamine amidotransferase